MDVQLLSGMIHIGISAVAMFFAIMVWGKTREGSWLFVVIGVIWFFLQAVLNILESLKLFNLSSGDPIIDLIIMVVKSDFGLICIAIGLLLAYRKF